MNTPVLTTDHLILRKYTEDDLDALFPILRDEEVNRFLPWFPVKDIAETRRFYEKHYASEYAHLRGYAYAICLKEDDVPIGYLKVDMREAHDFGYGLRREFWHRGIVTEAARAVVEQVRRDGLPFITATHDRNNPPPKRRRDAQRRNDVPLLLRRAMAAQGHPRRLPHVSAQPRWR